MKFIIDFLNTATQEQIDSYLTENNCSVIKNYTFFDKIYLVESINTPPADPIVEHIVNDELTHIAPLQVINVDRYVYTHQDPSATKLNLDNNSEQDWWKVYSYVKPNFEGGVTTISRLGKNVNVYILDSGIEISHPEFADANITQLYTISNDFVDRNGHGTAIASVIVGQTCGITDANVKIVKIFEQGHQTLQSELLNALDAVANDHVPNTFSIINASWAITKNQWVELKLRQLIESGIYVLAAAGNSGVPIENVTPASMADVLTVGAYNKDLRPCDFSDYTGSSITSVTEDAVNHGALDGWAPGQDIYAAGLNGTYGLVSGTSIATAIASAVCAINASHLVKADGSRDYGFEEDRISPTVIFNGAITVFSRKNLLEYDDPKYANSKNLIATISDLSIVDSRQIPDETQGYATVGQGIKKVNKIFIPSKTESIEFLNPLPSTFVLSKDGVIHGYVTEDMNLGPAEGESYKVHDYNFIRTNIDGTVENCVFHLYVLTDSFDQSTIQPDDPVNLVLLNICSNNTAEACAGGPGPTCTDFCSGSLSCCFGSAKPEEQVCFCTVPAGGGTCFAGETLITMSDGSTKPIESIREGDKILAFNFITNANEENIVEHIHVRFDRDVYQYTLSNGTILTATDDHPIYVLGKGWSSVNPRLTMRGYKSLRNDLVAHIQTGDKLFHKDGTPVEILEIKRTSYPGKVYTFNNKYKTSPTYYADGILAF